MILIDRSGEALPPARKTRNVKVRREMRDGKLVTVRLFDLNSPTLSDDLRYIFTANVRAARKAAKG
jgi:hypothetical protein